MKPVTDPALLEQLNAAELRPVTDEKLLAELNGKPKDQGTLKNIGMGAIKGAADIGATLLRPVDAALNATGLSDRTNADRRASMGQFFQENANPDSLAFQGGAIGSQIAGTAGVGGLMAKGVLGAAKAVPVLSNVAPKVATALQTGGFRVNPANMVGPMPAATMAGRVGDSALRLGAGGVTGGAMAGLVNPDEADTGFMIGAALPGAVKVAGMAGNGAKTLLANTIGTTTGAGTEAVRGAFNAGKTGAAEFLDNMRGRVPFDDVVSKAKDGLKKMRADRGAQYRSGMIDIKADKSVLDMSPIVNAVNDIKASGNFKGKVINEKAAGTIKEIAAKVDDWATSPANEFHTPEGLDALKQAIGDIRDDTAFGSPARRHADSVYNAIKDQIQKQAPTYSKVMKDYSEASNTLSEIEKSLSLGDKTSKDTAIRKLQSLMRNNAQTNYGNRLNLAKTLEAEGGVSLSPAIAGQAMGAMLPRGMVGSIEKAGMIGAPLMGNPGALLAAPFASPRLMGEAAYGLGALSRYGGDTSIQGLLSNPATRAGILNTVNQ